MLAGINGSWRSTSAAGSAFDFVTCRADWRTPWRLVPNELSRNSDEWNLTCPLVTTDEDRQQKRLMGQMRIQRVGILRPSPDTRRDNSTDDRLGVMKELGTLNLALVPGQGFGSNGAADGWSGMIFALLRRGARIAKVEETRVESGEIAIHVVPAINQLSVRVAGRVTVDSSPHLRSVLLELLHRGTASVVVIDLSAVSYLDMSGIATLLEALKAAHETSVTLRVVGIIGQVSGLAEIAQLDAIFRSLGSEVEFR